LTPRGASRRSSYASHSRPASEPVGGKNRGRRHGRLTQWTWVKAMIIRRGSDVAKGRPQLQRSNLHQAPALSATRLLSAKSLEPEREPLHFPKNA